MTTKTCRSFLYFSLILLIASGSAQSQQVPVDPKPGVIEVTTTLVEVDAVVTNKSGRAVTDLKAEDFQVLQDGKPQPISVFSHISAGPPLPAANATNLGPVRPLAREDVRRTIAFVIDDFAVGFGIDSARMFTRLRRTLSDFFDQKMREGDLVSLFSLAQRQAFEQFTNNRELLKSQAAGLKIMPVARLPASTSPDDADYDEDAAKLEQIDRDEEQARLQDLSLTVLESIVEGMRGMPGRKSIMLFSFGIRTPKTLSNLIDRANRAGITFYAIDPRDPEVSPPQAVLGNPGDVRNVAIATSGQAASSLTVLAKETGGQAWGRGFDRLDQRLDDAIADQNSYYVLGYNPGEGTFDRQRHKIEVKVLRKDLIVRSSRTDFLGQPDVVKPRPSNSAAVLTELLATPYGSATAVRTTLSTFFTAENGKGVLRSAIFIDGRDLQAEQKPDGTYQGGADIMAVTVNPNGEFSGHVGRSFRFKLDKEGWERARQTGFFYNLPHADEKPGPYQIRLAVRDFVSGATGSTSTFFVAPDTKKGDLTASSLVLSAPATETNPHPWSSPAARAFVKGHEIAWAFEIYNAKAVNQKDGGQFKLLASVHIFRNGELVIETPFAPWTARAIEGRKDVALRGLISTGSLEPGEYVLQVDARDENAKRARVSSLADFRILP